MDQVSVISLISSVGVVSGVVFGYVGYSKGAKKESHQEGEVDGEQKDINKSMNALAECVTRVEESTKSAHKRIDELTGEKGGG